jgi:hypothetical protein
VTKKERLTHYYRWQFLRLNKHYQKVCQLFAKGVKAVRDSHKLSNGEKQKSIEELEAKLYIQYGINGIYDYRKKNPPSELRIYGGADFPVQKGTLKGVFDGKLKDNQEIFGNHLLETIHRPKKVKTRKGKTLTIDTPLVTPKFVQVVINYDAELGDIKREIGEIIKPTQELRRKELGIKRPTTRSKLAIKDYKKYLRVWKLRSEGIDNKDVAEEVFPDEDSRAAEDKASKYFETATALVGGGYRKISF